jgi:N-acetylglutamate synthase-like GNAT family acetyltransferase
MTKPATQMRAAAEQFSEKDFYLEEFRARTLCFAAALQECRRSGGFRILGSIVQELVANGTRVIVLLGVPESKLGARSLMRDVLRYLRPFIQPKERNDRFPRRNRFATSDFMIIFDQTPTAETRPELKLELIWNVLQRRAPLVGLVAAERLSGFARRLAVALRIQKLVFVDPLGGISTASDEQVSFMDDEMLTAVLRAGEAEWSGLAERREILEEVQAALRGGVPAVNVCSMEGLARELYTYEGSGTLFTLEDYCRVERLGIDDFDAVERLITRGQAEGYLKPRSRKEVARILLNGYGAKIGERHVAGVCALETEAYRKQRAGEITGLYTITRFKGEGVGTRLVKRVLEDARLLGLRYVFACTLDARAQAFFERQGFRPVRHTDVPAVKWVGYDPRRRRLLKVLRKNVNAQNNEAQRARGA